MSLQQIIPCPLSLTKTVETPLYDVEKNRLIEAAAIAQVAADKTSLMQRAGYALYRLICARYPHAQKIWIVAGKGNNGGDALVAAVWLKLAGREVDVTWLGSLEQCSSDTAQAFQSAIKVELVLSTNHLHQKTPYDLIIDGLLGIGLDLNRPLDQETCALINIINHHNAPVISVDLPSGLDASTGATHSHCIKADCTLAFLCANVGLLTAQGRAMSGEIWLSSLDIQQSLSFLTSPSAYLYNSPQQLGVRPHNTHKGSYGDVSIIGGDDGMVGAALLAARSALHAGAGRVYVGLLASDEKGALCNIDLQQPELMFRNWNEAPLSSTVICGCGGGAAIQTTLPKVLTESNRLVLDADALNVIAQSKELQKILIQRASKELFTVITPHPLEAARLLGITTEEVQNDRLKYAQALADQFSCICVLKGSGTVVSAPLRIPYINSSGNAALATAGSGDVLAGWIGGRLSSSLTTTELHTQVALCVWKHGNTADQWVKAGHQGVLPASQITDWIDIKNSCK